MAVIDFPSSPIVGQEATLAGMTYVWSGQGWKVKAVPADSATAGITVGDTPPTSPQQGNLWYESDSGHLFVWYVDADGGQWVSTTIQGPAGANGVNGADGVLADAPSDGNGYVRANGAWRLKHQTLALAGVTGAVGVTVQVPVGAKAVKYTGNVYGTTAAIFNMAIRVSDDGSTMIITNNYRFGGVYFLTSGTAANPLVNTAGDSFALTNAVNVIGHPVRLEGHLNVVRTAGMFFAGQVRGSSWHTAGIYSNLYTYYGLEALTASLELKALCFGSFAYPTIVYAPGSFIDVEWVY